MPEASVQPSHGSYLLPHLDHATVADAMHPGILSCDPGATLAEVARMMATHHVHSIVVRSSADDPGNTSPVLGIVSDFAEASPRPGRYNAECQRRPR